MTRECLQDHVVRKTMYKMFIIIFISIRYSCVQPINIPVFLILHSSGIEEEKKTDMGGLVFMKLAF